MIQSFVVIPFFVALAGILFYTTVLLLTSDEGDVYALLDDIGHGSSSKRWQSAYLLSTVLNDPSAVPISEAFVTRMRETFEATARERDPRARQYMALALGRTGNAAFCAPLLDALDTDPALNRPYIIHALGSIGESDAASAVAAYVHDADAHVRLQTVIALGRIDCATAADALAEALSDSEPNVRWDAAIGLAKLADPRGNDMLLELLDREYLKAFDAVDAAEREHIIVTAVRASTRLEDPRIDGRLRRLAETDPDMDVRKAAREQLEKRKSYRTMPTAALALGSGT